MNYKFDGSKVFFTSDTHFYHGNIIRFCTRPFKDVEVMNETIISNWNNTVVKQPFLAVLDHLLKLRAISVLAVQPNGLKSLTG